MNFFGVFSFLLLFFTFVFTFTWYLGVIAIWAQKWEHKQEYDEDGQPVVSQGLLSDTTSSHEASSVETPDYPCGGLFDFMQRAPVFCVDSAGMPIEKYNVYEQFFYNYVSPVIYFYRLPIVVFFTIWAAIFGYFAFQTGTKSQLQFLPDDHVMQRAYTLTLNKFSTALNDFSFVFVWGIKPKPVVTFEERLTIDNYGRAEFTEIDVTNEAFQNHISWTWAYILNQTSFIDTVTSVDRKFGVNPWNRMWNQTFALDDNPTAYLLFLVLNTSLGMDWPPQEYPITAEQWRDYGWIWQVLLSELAFEEPDMYVPGTVKADTVGFSMDDYGLLYLGMKANMFIPDPMTVEEMRNLYNKAKKLEAEIEAHATDTGVPYHGWMTCVGWLTMVTEEELPKQVVKDVALAFGIGAIIILISTFSLLYMIFVMYSMLSTVLLVMGSLYFTGWTIGCNEAIMISIASGFCADFIIQPMLALAHDYSHRSLYGKIQASLTTFSTPVSSALITTLVAACFLYPCEILLFPPFATFLLLSGLFGIVQGFAVLPALVALLSFQKRTALDFGLGTLADPLFTKEDSDDIVQPLVKRAYGSGMPND
jgi:hypothetical protein